MTAVKSAISPFLLPLTAFATAARNAGATLNITVTGLSNALKGLIKIVQGLTDSLGLQGLDGILSNLGGLLGGLFM